MVEINLPWLGRVRVTMDPFEPGHFWWLDGFGWHDCSDREDQYILMNY
jgi:hypothetical protein